MPYGKVYVGKDIILSNNQPVKIEKSHVSIINTNRTGKVNYIEGSAIITDSPLSQKDLASYGKMLEQMDAQASQRTEAQKSDFQKRFKFKGLATSQIGKRNAVNGSMIVINSGTVTAEELVSNFSVINQNSSKTDSNQNNVSQSDMVNNTHIETLNQAASIVEIKGFGK